MQESFRSFIVWGGDGSFHRVVQSFKELDLWSDATAGLIPVGTCNDLARHLGLPIGDIPAALKTVQNPATAVDVGLVSWPVPQGRESRVFTNNAGFGRSSEAIREGWGPVKSVLSFKNRRMRLEAGKVVKEGAFLMGLICNGPFFNGGLHFSTDTSCSDGRLDAFFVRGPGRLMLLARLALGRLGRPLGEGGVERLNSNAITVRSEEALSLQADGEALAEGIREMEFSVMPRRLKIHR